MGCIRKDALVAEEVVKKWLKIGVIMKSENNQSVCRWGIFAKTNS